MRPRFALMALLLPLGGCVVPPDQVGYGYGYGYPGAYPAPDYGYPGFSYYDGSPTLAVEGGSVPLIFYGGNWGYWDHGHNWHRAPDRVAHNLKQRFPGGSGYRGWGGSPAGPPPGGGWQGHPAGGGWQGHVGGSPPGGAGFAGRPFGGPPPGGAAPGGPPRPAIPPGAAAHSPIASAISRIPGPPPSVHQRDDRH